MAFDDPNLVSAGGLVPVLALAEAAGFGDLADEHLSVPTDKGANAGLKVASLVGGMVAGAASIDGMALLRHLLMGRIFTRAYAPSTLGSFLRAFTFGHVRQLDAIASRFLIALAGLTPVLGDPVRAAAAGEGYALLDVDDTIIEVHGHAKQGAGFGYSGVRGLNALLATLATATAAPVIVAQRLRKGACGSPRGAKRLVGDAVRTARRLLDENQLILVRLDSAFYGRGAVHAALAGGAAVSVTVRMDKAVKKAIAAIDDTAWRTIEYTDAVFEETTGRWISRAEVAEVPFTAFAAQKKADHVPGRLVVRRIPDFNAEKNKAAGQDTLFDVWRFHAFFTTADPAILSTVTADMNHRGHAVIEQVHSDLKSSALAHLPSGVFTANAAWLVLAVIEFNLTRAAGTVAATDLAKATTATIRRKLITVPTRAATSARRLTLHLPHAWPWEIAWTALFDRVSDPPPILAADHPAAQAARPRTPSGTPGHTGPADPRVPAPSPHASDDQLIPARPIGGSRLREWFVLSWTFWDARGCAKGAWWGKGRTYHTSVKLWGVADASMGGRTSVITRGTPGSDSYRVTRR